MARNLFVFVIVQPPLVAPMDTTHLPGEYSHWISCLSEPAGPASGSTRVTSAVLTLHWRASNVMSSPAKRWCASP